MPGYPPTLSPASWRAAIKRIVSLKPSFPFCLFLNLALRFRSDWVPLVATLIEGVMYILGLSE